MIGRHQLTRTSLVVLAALAFVCVHRRPASAEEAKSLYLKPDAPLARRVDDLVSRMTLEEKVGQMMNAAPAIPRLEVPEYDWWNESLHGVARAGIATVFPQAIGLGATWDPDLVREMADVTSTEARAKHHEALRHGNRARYTGLTMWSPNINLFRDPRWGRGQETYGEDPYLMSRIGVAFVKGLQGDDPRYLKVVSTPKHYAVHSGPEPSRHKFDAKAGLRDLRQTYLPAFEATVREAGAFSVMCAYNSYQGQPACASDLLLGEILRKEWGFQGYVVSDCGAITDIWRTHAYRKTAAEASAVAVQAGCDLECGDDYGSLVSAVKSGLISEAALDVSLKRLFTARFRLGMFDPPERVPYAQIPITANDTPEHRALARRVAQESIVLLKNAGGILPLSKDLKRVAVIGPNADSVPVLLGNYNGTPSKAVTALAGLRDALPKAKVVYARGSDLADTLAVAVPAGMLRPADATAGVTGLAAEYFDNPALEGEPRARRVDAVIDYLWRDVAPAPGIDPRGFSARWTGRLAPTHSGPIQLGLVANDSIRLWIDGRLVIDEWGKRARRRTIVQPFDLVAGRAYDVKIEYAHLGWVPSVRLVYIDPQRPAVLRAQAEEAARQAEVAIVVLGIAPELEGEEMEVLAAGFAGGDRTTLDLPATQQQLLEAVVATGTPVVLVLMNGSALAVNWAAEHVPAIVEAWYGGEEAGSAIADILLGDANPSGRLPVTFYKSVDQLPPFEEYAMAGRTYRYFTGEPLLPFGHGLSYTEFRYTGLRVACACGIPGGCGRKKCAAGEKLRIEKLAQMGAATSLAGGLAKPLGFFHPEEDLKVSVMVENAGTRAGDEVVQLYLRDIAASVPVPLRSLVAFQRVSLAPGEKREVTLTVTPRQLSVLTDDGRAVVEPGIFQLWVGGKQPDQRGLADAATTGVLTAQIEVVKPAPPNDAP